MASLADYFKLHRYFGKWHLGDRVSGTWNKIPFIGTVGNDSLVNENEGPRVSIHLDLPIKFGDQLHNYIKVKPKDIKALKSFD